MWKNLLYIVFKYAMSASVIIAVSETAKRSDRLGGLLAALPIVTTLTLIWLEVESQSPEMISYHAWYTLWYAIPTLPMFAAFPKLYDWIGFWAALVISSMLSSVAFLAMGLLLKPFGITLY